MKERFKKFWKWLYGLFRKTTVLTMDVLLDISIDYFMRYYNKTMKTKLNARELLEKLEASIEKKIESTDNKFDDAFLDPIHDVFQRIDVVSIQRIIDLYGGQIEPILRRIKTILLTNMKED